MKATTLDLRTQFRPGLYNFILSSKSLLAAFLLLFSFAARANDKPYFESKDYFHWSDVPSGNWNNNNLNKAKSSYAEGDVVAHAFVPNGLSNDGTVYTWILKYDYYLSTKNAGGFVDLKWSPAQFSKSPADYFELTSPLSGATSQTLSSIGTYVAKNISLVSVTQLPDEPGQTTRKVWEIKFTYTGSTGADAALYFGLQLAKKGDVSPTANGAAAWAGASLQTDLGQQSDPGTRSLQIDPGAIKSSCDNPPTVSAGNYGTPCSNASPILLGGTPAGGTWTGTGVSGDATNGFYFDPSVGTQTLVYTYTDEAGCSNSDEITITVNQAPTVTAGSYDPVCSNAGPISLAGSPTGGVWSGTGVSGSQATGYTFDPSVGTQTLTYSYTDGNGCSGTAQTTVNVNTAPTVSAGNYGTPCSNASPILLGGTPAGGTWTGTGVSGDATNGFYFDPSAGTQKLTYSYTDGNGCSGTAQVTITVNTPPTCSITQTVPSSGNPQVGQVASYSAPSGYSYSWTISSVGNTANASIVNNTASSQTVQVVTTMTGSYTLQLQLTDAATSCSSTCSKPVTVSPSSPYTTYTKGFWGTAGGKFCGSSDGTAPFNAMKAAIGVSKTFGTGTYNFTLYGTAFTNKATVNGKSSLQIYQLLPGGNTPNVLKGSASSTPLDRWMNVPIDYNLKSSTYGSILNNLLAQGIAMFFNLANNGALGNAVLYGNKLTFTANNACATGSTTQIIPICVYNAAKVNDVVTVQSVYDIAMRVLGADNTLTGISASDANAALNALNVGFDKGKQITGVSMDITSCSALVTVMKSANPLSEDVVKALAVSAYPNPFTDKIRFTIQAPKAGKAILEVYNLLGQKVGVPFEGQLNAGESRNVEYTAPVNHRSSLIYRLSMNGEQLSGKLMGTRQ